ncbi:MAG: DUF2207 domain-containing protein [Anaerolineales bacterium]|nr:DUF2207 domain-containing protein [Anaerolineales bacterium]
MHRLIARSLTALALAVGLAAPLALLAVAAKDARAERFDVAVAAQPDGSLLVTETVVFVYTGGPFTFVTRDLPTERTDGIEVVEAQMDGVTLPAGDQPGQVEISGGDPVSVRWHFVPTSDSTHTFTLIYRALGVVTTGGDADVLRWQALPDEHDYTIDSSTITFSYPATAALLAPARVEAFGGAVSTGEASTTVTAANLGEDDTLIVELRFSPGSLTTATPAWQAAAEAHAAVTRQYAYPLSALAALLGLGGSLGGYLLWRRGQPAPLTDEGPIMSPPRPLAPALVGALVSGQGEPAIPTALGTLFDLAQRGVVSITQQAKPGFLGRPAQSFVVTLQDPRAGLAAHEQALLAQFFGPGAAAGAAVPLTEKIQALLGKWKPFAEPVKAALRERGWWDAARHRRRGAWLAWAFTLFFVSLAVLVAAAFLRVLVGDFVFLLPLGLFITSLTLLILASQISPYSDAGRAEAARWQRFSKYLTDVTANREAVTRPDLFEHYLAYAAALGLATNWLTFFQKRGEAAIPAWFRPLAAGDGAGMVALMAAVNSSGASSAAGAAGAGAAGGGASGTG